jgi:RNA polymerase sigma-70 factor, ECF subfamily
LDHSTTFNKRIMDSGEEAALVARARQDPEAFGLLYERYAVRIYRYLFSYIGEAAGAEDLTAQVFTAAWEGLRSYQERGEFAAWLFSIARNKANDYHRQSRNHLSWEKFREGAGSHQASDWDPLSNVEQAEDLERLASLVQRLDSHQVELLRLRFAAQLTYAEMASLLDRSEAAVKMAVHRLLRQLKAGWEAGDE